MSDDVQKVFSEIAKIQIRQNELALEIANNAAVEQFTEIGAELSKHCRDQHGSYWDSDYYIRCQRERRERNEKPRKEFEENQKRLLEKLTTLTEHLEST